MRHLADIPRWCDDVTEHAGPARFARRSLLKAAVLGRREEPGHSLSVTGEDGAAAAASTLVYTVTGKILDVSPHVLVLRTDLGEQRFPLASCAQAWRGGQVSPAALRQGDHAIVRRQHPGGPVVDRIWAQLGRVDRHDRRTERTSNAAGRRGPGERAQGRDHRQRGGRPDPGPLPAARAWLPHRRDRPEAGRLPAGADSRHLAAALPGRPPARAADGQRARARSGERHGGLARARGGARDLLGLAYPALDPETSCERPGSAPPECSGDEHAVDPHAAGPGCVRLPYLSLGSTLRLRNDCAERSRMLLVTSCGATARLFCDRCVTCGTSQQGPDRRPHHGGLRGTRRRPRSRLFQRHHDDRRLGDAQLRSGSCRFPLLAALLLGGCATKAWRVLRSRSIASAMDPAGLFPLRLRRPTMIAMCAAEFGLGARAGRDRAAGSARSARACLRPSCAPGRRCSSWSPWPR